MLIYDARGRQTTVPVSEIHLSPGEQKQLSLSLGILSEGAYVLTLVGADDDRPITIRFQKW